MQVKVVGRPGLEPGTYGLKDDRIYVGPCLTMLNCVALSNFIAFKMSENVGTCSWVPMAEEHATSTRPAMRFASVRS
jgi:hypothetical protein